MFTNYEPEPERYAPPPFPLSFAPEQPPPPPAPPRRQRGRYLISIVVLAIVAIGSVLIMTNRQYLVDQWAVWNYTSSPVVDGYIERSTMTDHAEFLFKASAPDVAAAKEFNDVCGSLEEGSGVLGCYINDSKKITLFDISDARLDGMEEVVASHEMLHAAWDRMSTDDRDRITALLETESDRLSGDAAFVARMELYARTEPGERANELHSIIGTEVADISPALEKYYAAYFDNRPALVALHTKSNAVFVQIETESAALVTELDALNASIAADGATYNSGYDALNADISEFNRRADNNEFESQEQFDAERAALMARKDALDALLVSIKARETTWNEKHAQLEALNAQAAALNTAINITPRASEE